MRCLLLLMILVSGLMGCGDDMPPTPDTSCGDLQDGQGRCTATGTEFCRRRMLTKRPCREGTVCDPNASLVGCECDLLDDGFCPSRCAADPDCESCEPSCAGKTCGDDGCGGVCGECTGDQVCIRSSCQLPPAEMLCEDTCGPEEELGGWADDGACDDGGDGDEMYCDYGTDCTDCGARPLLGDAGVPDMSVDDASMISCAANFNADCPSDQRCNCVGDQGDCFCGPGERGPSVVGAACDEATDCQSGLCFNEKCSQSCDDDNACPSRLSRCNPILGYCEEPR